MKNKKETVVKLVLDKSQPISVKKKKSKSVSIHTHDYFELEFVLSGEGEHILNGESFSINRGTVLFLTPVDCHIIKTGGGISLWNISFNHSLLNEGFLTRVYKTRKNHYQVDDTVLSKLEGCAILLEKEVKTTGRVKSLLEYLLSLVLPECEDEKTSALDNALLFAKTRFRENPTVKDASKIACLSPVYFGNVFKRKYGVSFNEYVNIQKVECAKVLLSNGMSVAETCFESGFNSLSNFLKVFKSHTGISPKEYKK